MPPKIRDRRVIVQSCLLNEPRNEFLILGLRKPDWDDSVNDLSVYKASEDDLLKRKLLHQSKNIDIVKEHCLHKKIVQVIRKNVPSSDGIFKEVVSSRNIESDINVYQPRKSESVIKILEETRTKGNIQKCIDNNKGQQTRNQNGSISDFKTFVEPNSSNHSSTFDHSVSLATVESSSFIFNHTVIPLNTPIQTDLISLDYLEYRKTPTSSQQQYNEKSLIQLNCRREQKMKELKQILSLEKCVMK